MGRGRLDGSGKAIMYCSGTVAGLSRTGARGRAERDVGGHIKKPRGDGARDGDRMVNSGRLRSVERMSAVELASL